MDINLFGLDFAANLHLELGDFLVLGYLDAGTGSLIFQVLVAGLVSAGVVFSGLMTQLRAIFSRVVLGRRPELSASEPPQSSGESVVPFPSEQPADGGRQASESDRHRKAA
ncbi:MAG: hypothetical protein IAG10_00500 [Planctomycetaceae bacterium]|nr:hypothetical protein [Planctomycetaceae bacterium]